MDQIITADTGIPIVIGITGHRDACEPEAIQNKIKAKLNEALSNYKYSQFIVMTALATGPDRLIVKAVSDLKKEYRERVKLLAVLPLPKDEYIADWQDDQPSLIEFEQLSKQCDDIFELPLSYKDDGHAHYLTILQQERREGAQFREGSLRNKRYALVGSYIARHSHILIAVWDGSSDKKEGGTRWVIADFEEGCALTEYRKDFTGVSHDDVMIPDLSNFRGKGLGSVWHIPCRREGAYNPEIDHSDQKPKWLNNGNWPDFLGDINRFNERTQEPEIQSAYGRSLDYFKLAGLSDRDELRVEKPFIRRLTHVHAMADAMAVDTNNDIFRKVLALSILSFVAVLCLIADDRLGGNFWLKGVFFFSALIVYTLRRRYSLNGDRLHHLQCRSLAEGLRTQVAWISAGLQSSVVDYYPQKYISQLGWVTHALRGLHAGVRTEKNRSLCHERIDYVLNHWIIDQSDYVDSKINTFKIRRPDPLKKGYSPRIQGYRSLSTWCEKAATWLNRFGYAFVVWIFVSSLPIPGFTILDIPLIVEGFLVVIPLALSLAIRRFVGGMCLREESEWYESILSSFNLAQQRLEGCSDADKELRAQALLKLGGDLIHENSAWVDLHRRNDIFGAIKFTS